MNSYLLRGDFNQNGMIDNNKEERANIEFNAKDIQTIQNELKNLKKKLNVSVSSNAVNDYKTFASTAKIAEELSDGMQRVYFNNLGKTVVFKNANKPMSDCIQIGTNTNVIKNVDVIEFKNDSAMKGVVHNDVGLSEEDLEYYVPSMKLVDDIGKSHTHITTQISREYFEEEQYQEEEEFEEEEEYEEEEDGETITKTKMVNKTKMVDKYRDVAKYEPLDDILNNKSEVGHKHPLTDVGIPYEEEQQFEEEETFEEEEEYEEDGETKTRIVEKWRKVDKTKIVNKFKPLDVILETKSDVGHKHITSDISRRYEEEEDIEEEDNGETVTVTKTITKYKPLEDILSGKSDVGHNHDERYSNINHNHDLVYSNINHNHNTSYAQLNAPNTFNQTNTFNAATYMNQELHITDEIYQLISNLSDNGNVYHYIGKSTLTDECGAIHFKNNATATNRYIGLGLNFNEVLKIYNNKIQATVPIESSSTIVGSNVLANNETRLAAIETAITTYTPLTNITSEISNTVTNTDSTKIPNVIAIRSYCSDYLTADDILNDSQLQETLRGDNGLSAFEVWVSQQPPKQSGEYTYQEYLNAITGPQGIQGPQGPKGEDGADGKDADGKSWWEYLISYGLSGVGAASSIASIVSVQGEISALQSQIAVLQGQIAAIVGADTAEAMADAVADVADTSLSLGQRAANVFQSIANVFRNIVGNLQVARQGANAAVSTLHETLVPVAL